MVTEYIVNISNYVILTHLEPVGLSNAYTYDLAST